ncbi:unnamed protein product, partial [Brassica oleracea]
RNHNFLLSKKKNIKTLLASMVKTWVLNISKLDWRRTQLPGQKLLQEHPQHFDRQDAYEYMVNCKRLHQVQRSKWQAKEL